MANDSITIDILGDNSDLDSSLKDTSKNVGSFAGAIPIAIGTAMAGVGLKIIDSIVGAFQSAFNIVKDFIGDSFALLGEQQAQENKLAAVIKATGAAAGFTAEELGQMASELQKVTTVGDETILSAQAIIATFKNVQGENFTRTTKAALDMAAVMEGDVKTSALQVAKALQDPLKGLTQLTRVGVTFTEQQREQVEAMVAVGDVTGAQGVLLEELEGQFGGAAEAAAGGLGAYEQFENRIGDVKEEFAEGLMPVLEAFAPLMDGVLRVVEGALPVFQDWVKEVFDMGEIIKWFEGVLEDWGPTVLNITTFVQTAFTNLGDLIDLWGASAALSVVRFANQVEHLFTGVIPDFLMWFADNWVEIFTDVGNFLGTVLLNMGNNIVDFIAATASALSGEGFNFEFTALTEGFESALKELPEIAARQKGDVEMELERMAAGSATSFAVAFIDNLQANQSAIDFAKDLFGAEDDGELDIPKGTGGIGVDAANLTQAKEKKKEKEKKEKKEKEEKPEEEKVGAGVVGLEALVDKIGGATGFTQAEQELITTQIKSHELTEAQTKALEEDADENAEKTQTVIKEGNEKLTTQVKDMLGKADMVIGVLGQMLGVLPSVGVLKGP